MKVCSSCREEKDPSEFNKNRLYADGLQRACRTCQRAASLRYREAHRDEDIARARKWRADNPVTTEEQKAKRSARWQEWYQKNREKRLQYHRQYKQENREAIRVRENARYQKDSHVSARRLIQSRVQSGAIPRVTTLPCHDCEQQAEEYDHYMGYEGKAREMVQPVCKPCHRQREMLRKEAS